MSDWQPITDDKNSYPVGTVMLISMKPDHYYAIAVPGFWNGSKWVLSEEMYSDTQRHYVPTHYLPLPPPPKTEPAT